MLTREQVMDAAKRGVLESQAMDRRDFGRLAHFFAVSDFPKLGLKPHKGIDPSRPPREWSEREVLTQLREDVEFGFEKALGRRGISADAMYSCVMMWLFVLEDEDTILAAERAGYAQYGLPLLKLVALKYDFPNPIGADTGREKKYASAAR